jgi:hypothetical protein
MKSQYTFAPSAVGISTMWKVIIQCSDDSWRNQATAFKAVAEKYPGILISSKKMPGDDRRIMSYQLENVSDAEEFTEECLSLSGFTAMFESL